MADKDYGSYDDLVRSLRRDSGTTPVSRRPKPGDDEIEMFVTSEDKAREARLKENSDYRDHRPGSYRPPEESVYFRFTDKTRVRKYSDEELAGFREGAKRVIVHDYGENDFYHQTDEERERNDQLATISLKLGSLKRIYRSVDKYVEAMRIVYEAWSILADNNPIHTRDEFFDYVARGIIVSGRIIIPKLKGIDNYNEDLLLSYISNPDLDPKDLIPKPISDLTDDYYYADLDEQKLEMDTLLKPEELEYLLLHDSLPPEEKIVIPVKPIQRKFLKAYDDRQTLGRKRKGKKLKKVDRDLQPDMTAILKKLVDRDVKHDRYGYGMFGSFNSLTDIFDASRQKSYWDRMPYRGSWQDDDAVHLYELAIEEEHLSEPIPDDPALTYGDKQNAIFYKTLEAAGVSTVEMRRSNISGGSTYLKERDHRSRKANRKIERIIINRLGQLQEKPEFKKLIKRSEKSLERYRSERLEEEENYGE